MVNRNWKYTNEKGNFEKFTLTCLLVCLGSNSKAKSRYQIKNSNWRRKSKNVLDNWTLSIWGARLKCKIEKVSRIRCGWSACPRSWSHAVNHVTTWRVQMPLMIVCYIGNTCARVISAITRVTPNRARAQLLIALLIEVYKEEMGFETAIIALQIEPWPINRSGWGIQPC